MNERRTSEDGRPVLHRRYPEDGTVGKEEASTSITLNFLTESPTRPRDHVGSDGTTLEGQTRVPMLQQKQEGSFVCGTSIGCESQRSRAAGKANWGVKLSEAPAVTPSSWRNWRETLKLQARSSFQRAGITRLFSSAS
jgi:hypothetical protein